MKDTYYFSHDYEPTSDPKIQAMIGVYGALGYGLYWRIVEMLHSDESHKLPMKQYIYISLSKQMLTAVEHCSTLLNPVETVLSFINDCINLFELFESDGEYIFSKRVNKNINKREVEKINKSNAGRASAEKRKQIGSTDVQQPSTAVEQDPTAVEQDPTKERKGKERKGIDNTIFPLEKQHHEIVEQFYKDQVEQSGNDEQYKNFVNYLFGNSLANNVKCTNILSIKNQLTKDEFKSLMNRRSKEKSKPLSDIVSELENYKPASKKYTSVYRTLLKWIQLDIERKSS